MAAFGRDVGVATGNSAVANADLKAFSYSVSHELAGSFASHWGFFPDTERGTWFENGARRLASSEPSPELVSLIRSTWNGFYGMALI